MFYEFNQNNSGGHFVVNDSLCNRLFIEAADKYEAISKAEELGCYWDGVAEGIDYPCCGDRWSNDFLEGIGEDNRIFNEYSVDVYSGYKNPVDKWCFSNSCLKVNDLRQAIVIKTDDKKKIDGTVTLVSLYEVYRRYRSDFKKLVGG